jgi:cholesterol transport system auxiliary component
MSLRLLAAAAASLALVGCVSLLPKTPAAQLYRFKADLGPAAAAPAGRRVDVALAPLSFTQAAAGDRLLIVDGAEAAFIADTRWVAPADALFRESLMRSFDSAPGTRLLEPRQAPAASLVMDVRVDTFEAEYRAGMKAAPTVVVGLNVRLVRVPDRVVVAEKQFQSEVKAGDNRLSAIVPAYDAALTQALKDLVAWTDQIATRAAPAG